MYWKGAMKNAALLNKIYPGWKLRIYCSYQVDAKLFKPWPCEVVVMGESKGHSGMFWRFLPAWEREFDYVIFRDADSRINVREAAAVQEWIASGKKAHTMCDHLHHRSLPLFGGMWGIKPGALPSDILDLLKRNCKYPQKRVDDMYFLAKRVYPLIENSILRHSSVPVKWPSVPFPKHPPFDGFVGQQYNDAGCRITP
jgi:hypothetical protein